MVQMSKRPSNRRKLRGLGFVSYFRVDSQTGPPWVRFVISRTGRRPWVRFVIFGECAPPPKPGLRNLQNWLIVASCEVLGSFRNFTHRQKAVGSFFKSLASALHFQSPVYETSELGLGAFDGAGCRVPGYLALAEIRFIGHVARDGGVVAEHGVFDHWLPRLDGLEEIPHVRREIVVVAAAEDGLF